MTTIWDFKIVLNQLRSANLFSFGLVETAEKRTRWMQLVSRPLKTYGSCWFSYWFVESKKTSTSLVDRIQLLRFLPHSFNLLFYSISLKKKLLPWLDAKVTAMKFSPSNCCLRSKPFANGRYKWWPIGGYPISTVWYRPAPTVTSFSIGKTPDSALASAHAPLH